MKIKDRVKVECIKQGKCLSDIANEIGITRHNYYFHLNKCNSRILRKTEKILGLKVGYFN